MGLLPDHYSSQVGSRTRWCHVLCTVYGVRRSVGGRYRVVLGGVGVGVGVFIILTSSAASALLDGGSSLSHTGLQCAYAPSAAVISELVDKVCLSHGGGAPCTALCYAVIIARG